MNLMRTVSGPGRPWCMGLMLTLLLAAGCGDDDETATETEGDSLEMSGGADSDSGVSDSEDDEEQDDDDTNEAEGDASTPDDDSQTSETEEANDGELEDTMSSSPESVLAEAWSLAGCESVGFGPLCTLAVDGATVTANCGGAEFTGELNEDAREVMLSGPESTTEEGATVTVSCEAELQAGRWSGTCVEATAALGETPASEETCEFASARTLLPGVTCMELPATIAEISVCDDGAGGTYRDCAVLQDGCNYQLTCAEGGVVSGSVSATGLSFSTEFAALADAQLPEEGEPAFLAGDEVSHSCSLELVDGAWSGECGAGRVGRGGSNTSVCSISVEADEVAQCAPLAESEEKLFVLDSCELMKEGEAGMPGIGEPICALRQNNCIWEVQCGRGDSLRYTGRLEAGATKIEWNLPTGTPCELEVDGAGEVSGSCTVTPDSPCTLGSKPAAPGGEECGTVITDTEFYAVGCGARAGSLVCRDAVQHGCDFMAVCEFTGRYPSAIFAGTISVDDGAGHLDFNGLNDWSCSLDQATAEDVATDGRKETEWYGQCTTEEGGMCRDNYDPTTGEGFRGLQLFFEAAPVEEEG